MTPEFPDDWIQSLCDGAWWTRTEKPMLDRGRLIKTFIAHVDQEPQVLVVEGRTDPTAHAKANYRVEPLNIKAPARRPSIPVAALPEDKGERRVVYKGKVRPALVLATEATEVERDIVSGGARWQTAKTLLVAPYYGADRDGSRGGWNPKFVDRIKRGTYPQYVCDKLPIGGPSESILRLDQLQAVGKSSNAIEVTDYKLSENALAMIDEWLDWHLRGGLPENGVLLPARELLIGVAATE